MWCRGEHFISLKHSFTLILFYFQAYDKADDVPSAKREWAKKQDPTEYLNMIHPNNYSR